MRRIWDKRKGIGMMGMGSVLILIIALVLSLPRYVPQLASAEHWISDWRVSLFSDIPAAQNKDILLVTITEQTIRQFPYRSPVDRAFLSGLISKLDELQAKVIAVDVIFDQPTEPTKDADLLAVLKMIKTPVVLGYLDPRGVLEDWQSDHQENFLREVDRTTGYLNIGYDKAGVVRTIPGPAKAEPAAKSFVSAIASNIVDVVPQGDMRIDYIRAPQDGTQLFKEIPGHLIFGEKTLPDAILSKMVQDKIVLIGARLNGRDIHPIPYSVMAGFEGGIIGLEIHAQALLQLLDGRSLTGWSVIWEAVFVTCFAFIGLLIIRSPNWRTYRPILVIVVSIFVILLDISSYFYLRKIFPGASVLFAMQLTILIFAFSQGKGRRFQDG